MPKPRKTTTRKSVPPPAIATSYQEKKSVRITEADNGFSVSTYGSGGEKILIAKSAGEAMRHAKTLLSSAKK